MRYFILALFLLTGMCPFAQAQEDSEEADAIIIKAVKNRHQNRPERKLDQFRYRSYEKTLITDSLYDADSAHSFFAEHLSQITFIKGKSYKEDVVGINVAGFEEPRLELLGITLQSRSFYDDDFVIFNYRYAGPISPRGIKNYKYTWVGEDNIEGRQSVVVGLSPKDEERIPGLFGKIWLDAETYAIQKVSVSVSDNIHAILEQTYQYFEDRDLYLPKSARLFLEKGKTSRRLSIFKGNINMGTIGTGPLKESVASKYLLTSTINSDYNFSDTLTVKHPKLAIEISEEAGRQSDEFWKQNRPDPLTDRDRRSFNILEEVVAEERIKQRLAVIDNFGIGYFRLGFWDFDLTYPVKFNNYEGLRLGLGGVTNSSFSKDFRLEGYTAYGFKDAALKYGLGAGVLLNRSHGAWLSANYSDDLREVGAFNYLTDRRVYSLFEPRLVNIKQFYDYKTFRVNQQFQVTPQLLSELQVSQSDIVQTSPYRFQLDGNTFSNYVVNEVTLGARWSPSSKFLGTDAGVKEIYDGYPKISAQLSKGISGMASGDFDFWRMGAKFYYQVERLNGNTTQFLVEGNAAFGELPLTHLFHAYPNAPTKETVLQRFSVAGINSFETMYFGEFYSDRLLMLQIKHRLRAFEWGRKWRPELVFISRYALGDVRDQDRHLDVQFGSLKQGYTESGFEINNIIFGFGTSLTYRYGAYHLDNLEDNIAFKFTFNMAL
ncbi:MAG: DUF5686 family protein [Leeuwenhoekiella sp.]